MMNRLKPYKVYTVTSTLNEYNEEVAQGTILAATIEMAVSVLTGSTINSNNVNTVNSTHLGITDYRGLAQSQILVSGTESYSIDFINDSGRKVLVYLKRVATIE